MPIRYRSALLAAVALSLSVSAAAAQSPGRAQISTLEAQEGLVWIGLYDGQLNGRTWPSAAVRRFQRDIGARPTGVLTQAQASVLAERAEAKRQAVGYTPYFDRASGVRVGLPQALASRTENTANGTHFASPDGRLQIELASFPGGLSWAQFIASAKASRPDLRITYSAQGSGWLVITGHVGAKQFYSRVRRNAGGINGFAVIYDDSIEQVVEPVIVAMSSDFAQPALLARE